MMRCSDRADQFRNDLVGQVIVPSKKGVGWAVGF